MTKNSYVKRVEFGNNKVTLVPSRTLFLNYKNRHNKKFLTLFWVTSSIDEIEFDWFGENDIYGWFTNYPDLYKMGRHTPMLRTADTTNMQKEVLEVINTIQDILISEDGDDVDIDLHLRFMLMDIAGGNQPIGTYDVGIYKNSAERGIS